MVWGDANIKDDGEKKTIFIFNNVISRFGVQQAIVTYHGIHFWNFMMANIIVKLGLCDDSSTPYYPHENGQVEVINKVLTTMIK